MNDATKRVIEIATGLVHRFQRTMRNRAEVDAIDYDDLASAAADAQARFHDERPALAYSEDMQAVEVALCSEFGVDHSHII